MLMRMNPIGRKGRLACRIAVAIVMGAPVCGCAGGGRKADVQPGSLPESMLQSSSNSVVRRLTSADHGLQVRKWVIATDSDRLAAVMMSHQDGAAAGAEVLASLQRNGLRLVRVPVDDVDAVLSELGGASMNIDSWFGQAVTWSEAHGRAVQEPGRAIAVDGRVQWFETGEVRLMIRSWTLFMEDGPRMQLELLPQYHKPRAQDFSRILGRQTPPDAMFSSIALDVRMEVGHAYLLLWEQPQVQWLASEPDEGEPGAEPASSGAASSPQRRSTIGPAAEASLDDALGPDAALPQSLGEMLLGGVGHPPTRGVIAFIPRIPAEVFPPSDDRPPASAGDTGRGER